MVLPVSGPISLSDLRTEFGGSAPDSLSEYYRGGGLVPDTPANASIPTSGQQVLPTDYYGGDASAGIGFTTGAIFGASNFNTITTDGSNSVLVAQGNNSNLNLRRTTTANLATPIWLTQSNASNNVNSLRFLTGTTVYAANGTFSGTTNFSMRNASAFTSTGFSTLSGLTSGPNGGCGSIATNGTNVVTAAGNVHWASSNPTIATPTWARTVTGTITGTNTMDYFSGTGQNLFVEWNPGGSGQNFAYNSNGLGAWTNGGFPWTGGGFRVDKIYSLAVKESGGTVTAVCTGQLSAFGSPASGPFIVSTTAATLALCMADTTWTKSATPSSWQGSTAGHTMLWVPAANSSAGYFVAADNNGNFVRSSNGSTGWTGFDTALASGGINRHAAVDLGSKSMWGTSAEGILTFNAADIP